MFEEPTVFISHATEVIVENDEEKDTPDRTCLRNLQHKIAQYLQDKSVKPFVDFRNIQVADNWRIRIDRGLGNAVVGILFLNERAKSRPWVFKEAVIMCWMKKIWPEFKFIIIGYGENIVQDWLNSPQWHIENISDIQHINFGLREGDIEFSEQCFEKLKPFLDESVELTSESACYQYKKAIARQLSQYNSIEFSPLLSKALGDLIVEGIPALAALFEQQHISRDHAMNVLQLLAPQWMEPEVAEKLSLSAFAEKLCFSICCTDPMFTASSLISQYRFSPFGKGAITLYAPKVHSEEGYIEQLESILVQDVLAGGYQHRRDINRYLSSRLDPTTFQPLPVFLIIPPEIEIADSIIRDILDKWSLLRVIRMYFAQEQQEMENAQFIKLNFPDTHTFLAHEEENAELYHRMTETIVHTGMQE